MGLSAVQSRAMYETRPSALVVATDLASEPLSSTVAKLHCRIDLSTDDTLVTGLITTARLFVEQYTGRVTHNKTLHAWFDDVPAHGAPLLLPTAPVTAITSITTYDLDNTATVFASASYYADLVSEPCRIALNDGYDWPDDLRDVNAVKVIFTAGYGTSQDSSTPAPMRQAMLLLISYLYENRDAGVVEAGLTPAVLPLIGALDLLAPYRLTWI